MTPTELRHHVDQLEVDHHLPAPCHLHTLPVDTPGATPLTAGDGRDGALVHGDGVILTRPDGPVVWCEVWEHGERVAALPVERHGEGAS